MKNFKVQNYTIFLMFFIVIKLIHILFVILANQKSILNFPEKILHKRL